MLLRLGKYRFQASREPTSKRSQWASMGPKSMTGALLRRDTEGHMKMEMETGVMLPQAKGSQSQQGLEQAKKDPLLVVVRNYVPAATLISDV